MTLATYRGITWRVAARRWAPFPYVELETPSGGRCAVPASHIEVHEVMNLRHGTLVLDIEPPRDKSGIFPPRQSVFDGLAKYVEEQS